MDKSGKYYIVKERALPEVLLKVVEAKRLIDSEKAMTVQEATHATGISRSSYKKNFNRCHGYQQKFFL